MIAREMDRSEDDARAEVRRVLEALRAVAGCDCAGHADRIHKHLFGEG